MSIRRVLLLAGFAGFQLVSWPSNAADKVELFAAGSLRDALGDVTKTFQNKTGVTVSTTFGPSGLLREKIENGARAHVFASADMGHPNRLLVSGRSSTVTRFARNELCALTRNDYDLAPVNLLDVMLNPAIRLATSTPKADPSGDYAFALFAKAEKVWPGAQAILEAKALQLVGGPKSAAPPSGRSVYGWHLTERRADIFLAYCTAANAAQKEVPAGHIVRIPTELEVGAEYGLIVLNDAPKAAQELAAFILSDDGQSILKAHGFGGR